MRRMILALCVLSVLAWAAGSVRAQGQGKGKERADRSADRSVNPNKLAETAKPDANAPAGKQKALTPQDIEKGAKEKAKGAKERGQEDGQMRGKAAKDQVAGKIAETKGKAREQQMRAFEKQTQHDAAKHMERQARLARLRELAVQKGDAKMIARVDELIAKENKLHDRKLTKMQGQKRAGEMLPPVGAPAPAEAKPEAPTPPPAAGRAVPTPEAAKPSAEKPNEAKP